MRDLTILLVHMITMVVRVIESPLMASRWSSFAQSAVNAEGLS
jgi:hypothetical protein